MYAAVRAVLKERDPPGFENVNTFVYLLLNVRPFFSGT